MDPPNGQGLQGFRGDRGSARNETLENLGKVELTIKDWDLTMDNRDLFIRNYDLGLS